MISGGGSQSDEAMQIGADVFGVPAVRPHLTESSALGAAIVAAVGVGLYPDFETAVKKMTRPGKRFQPNSQNHAVYDHIYRNIYKKMYWRLRRLYRRMLPS